MRCFPVVTILGLQFSFLVAGAVLVENVFSLPGPRPPRLFWRWRKRDPRRAAQCGVAAGGFGDPGKFSSSIFSTFCSNPRLRAKA